MTPKPKGSSVHSVPSEGNRLGGDSGCPLGVAHIGITAEVADDLGHVQHGLFLVVGIAPFHCSGVSSTVSIRPCTRVAVSGLAAQIGCRMRNTSSVVMTSTGFEPTTGRA